MDLASGYPFWPIADGLIRCYPRLTADLRADVAVIGAGITGALIAHRLIEAGIDTVVLDRREVGWGSTAASTALLQYEIDVPLCDLARLRGANFAARAYIACRDAIGALTDLAESLPEDIGFSRKNSLYLATRREDVPPMRGELDARRRIGIDVEWLDEGELAARFPFTRPGALLSRDGAQVDAYAFTHALLHAAVQGGARIFDRTSVSDIDAGSRRVDVRTANGCVVRARHLVMATGYEAASMLSRRVAKLTSTFAVASEPIPDLGAWGEDRCVIWECARPYLYLRTTADGRVIIGGEDEALRSPAVRDRLLPAKTRRLVKRFRELFPDTPFEPAFAWAGTFGETEDGIGYVGSVPEWPSTSFALCYGGNGITFGAIAAEIIRDSLRGARNEAADLFRFDR